MTPPGFPSSRDTARRCAIAQKPKVCGFRGLDIQAIQFSLRGMQMQSFQICTASILWINVLLSKSATEQSATNIFTI